MTLAQRKKQIPAHHALLAALLILAAFAPRIAGLGSEPRGLYVDESGSALESLRMARSGDAPLYLPTPIPENLFAMLGALAIKVIGPSLFTIRLVSVFTSLIGLAAAYRAARHLAVRRSARWVGLLAAGMLAAMPGYLTLSRAVYRGVMMVPALLMFFDCFIAAWQTNRRRDFIGAGVWLAVTIMSYTSGLAALPLAGLGVLIQGISAYWDKKHGEARARLFRVGLATFALAALIALIPHMYFVLTRPDFYARAASLEAGAGATLLDRALVYVRAFALTAQSFYLNGDPNPRYNVAQQPLINDPVLLALAALGVIVCLARLRRLEHLLVIAMLGLMMVPVALAGEIPHGLRICGEFAALPLAAAAGIEPVLWAGAWLARRVSIQPWLNAAGAAALFALIAVAGLRTGRIYQDYFSPALSKANPASVPDFATIFETRRLAIAQDMAAGGRVAYLPLSEASWGPMHYFMAAAYPQVETYAVTFAGEDPIQLPAGRVYFTSGARRAQLFSPNQGDSTRVLAPPPPARDASTYVMLLPDGRMILLPRFDEPTLAALREALSGSRQTLPEPYGGTAATLVDFPTGGSSMTVAGEPAHAVDLNYADQLRLIGWDGPERLAPSGDTLEETLYLARGQSYSRDLRLFAQLWDVDHNLVGSTGEPNGLYSNFFPMSTWQPGDVVPYLVTLKIPQKLTPGVYSLVVGVYDWRGELLPVLGPDGRPGEDVGVAARLKVPPGRPVSTAGMIAAAGDLGGQLDLIGYRLDGPDGKPITRIEPGQSAVVTLFWRAARRPDADYTFFLHVVDGAGQLVAQQDTQPRDGRYPTGILDPGEVVTTVHAISLPAGAKGPFRLYTGAYSFPDLARLPASQDGRHAPDDRILLLDLP